jgi:hypothetical protein
MKTLLLSIFLLLLSDNAFSTAQIPDRLIYKGDTIFLFDCPLSYYPDKDYITPKNLFGSSGCVNTACWRNYVATWLIENDKLYLIQIRNACYHTALDYVGASYQQEAVDIGQEFADLKKLFPDRYENGRVPANWVSAIMYSPLGKILFYINDGFSSIYEREIEFNFNNGTLVNTQEFDNSKTRISKYNANPELLIDFIQSGINYSNVPYPDHEIKIRIHILGATADGKVDKVSISKGYNEIYEKEALRVVNSIPEWDVMYRHGKQISIPWLVTVTFKPML